MLATSNGFIFMHVIKRRSLVIFWRKHTDVAVSLNAWFREAQATRWESPQDIKLRYRSADFLSGNRVVFKIGAPISVFGSSGCHLFSYGTTGAKEKRSSSIHWK